MSSSGTPFSSSHSGPSRNLSDWVEDPIVFTGIDGRECERFIRSIKSHAFAQQKQRDYEWMADLAATLFDGAALRWYSQLDEDVQGNWKLLEKALLTQYPAEGQRPEETPPGRFAALFTMSNTYQLIRGL